MYKWSQHSSAHVNAARPMQPESAQVVLTVFAEKQTNHSVPCQGNNKSGFRMEVKVIPVNLWLTIYTMGNYLLLPFI